MKKITIAAFAIALSALFTEPALAQPAADESAEPVSLKLTEDSSSYRVEVLISGDPRCFFGDIDAMRLDSSRNPKASLLLTIEPLNGAADFPGAATPVENMQKVVLGNYHTSVTLPKLNNSVPLGIFLCLDSTGKNRCGEKTPKPIDEIIKEYKVEGGKAPKLSKKVDDRVYFFRFALLEQGGLTFFDKAMTDARYDKLRSMLQNAAPNDVEQIMARIKALNTLQSMPLVIKNGKELGLILPFYNPSKCSVE